MCIGLYIFIFKAINFNFYQTAACFTFYYSYVNSIIEIIFFFQLKDSQLVWSEFAALQLMPQSLDNLIQAQSFGTIQVTESSKLKILFLKKILFPGSLPIIHYLLSYVLLFLLSLGKLNFTCMTSFYNFDNVTTTYIVTQLLYSDYSNDILSLTVCAILYLYKCVPFVYLCTLPVEAYVECCSLVAAGGHYVAAWGARSTKSYRQPRKLRSGHRLMMLSPRRVFPSSWKCVFFYIGPMGKLLI